MRYCTRCQRTVKPRKCFSLADLILFIFLLPFYLPYYVLLKRKQCPICGGKRFSCFAPPSLAEAVTEVSAAHYIDGELYSYGEAGIDQYAYLATLDLRTCPKCGVLDGKVFKVSEAQPGVNYPPMCDSCRCTTVAHFDDEFTVGAQRWSRSPVTGKGELVPANITYSQWYKHIVDKHGIETIKRLQAKASRKREKRGEDK